MKCCIVHTPCGLAARTGMQGIKNRLPWWKCVPFLQLPRVSQEQYAVIDRCCHHDQRTDNYCGYQRFTGEIHRENHSRQTNRYTPQNRSRQLETVELDG